jgi:hypothetical protein
MGYALCRFDGCTEKGSTHYLVRLTDLNKILNVPIMWKHYMTEHLVQPTELEREIVMAADPEKAISGMIVTGCMTSEIKVMYVERTETGYTHELGDKPDTEFVDKLEMILSKSGG